MNEWMDGREGRTRSSGHRSGVWELPLGGWAHLEADLEVLTVLAAATELATETLVDMAAAFIRAIAAVILAVAEQCLCHTAPAAAQELRGGVALVLCGGQGWQVSGCQASEERGDGSHASGPPGLVQCGFLGASSLWSWQSFSPSHSHWRELRQRPLAQRNSLGPQVGYSRGGRGSEIGGTVPRNCRGHCFFPPWSPELTTLWGLVRSICAVTVMVTHKVFGNALVVLAHELTVVTGAVVHYGQRGGGSSALPLPATVPPATNSPTLATVWSESIGGESG